MSALTPFELDLLEAVEHRPAYPTEAIAAAIGRPFDDAVVATALNLMHDLGYVARFRVRDSAHWSVTLNGRDALAFRRSCLSRRAGGGVAA